MIPAEIVNAVGRYTGLGFTRRSETSYEAYAPGKAQKTVFLGSFESPEAAQAASIQRKLENLENAITGMGLNIENGIIVHNRYIAFPDGTIVNLHGRLMQGVVDHCGYVGVVLNQRNYLKHRIIAEAFVPNPDAKPHVNHINGIKTDNTASNLEWVTRSENTLHSYRMGLQKTVGGGGRGRPPVTVEEDRLIKTLHIQGLKDKEIANSLGRTTSTVSKRIRRMKLR